MATAGVLTASHLTTAFTNSADEINAAYAETGVTISEAMQIAKDKIGLVLTQSDEGIKLTTTIAQLILKATDYLTAQRSRCRSQIMLTIQRLFGRP